MKSGLYKNLYSILVLATIVVACTKSADSPYKAIEGNWAIRYMHSYNSYDSTGYNTAIRFSGSQIIDTQIISFNRSGTYTAHFITGIIITGNTYQNIWQTENGTYDVRDGILDLTTATSSSLYRYLHSDFPTYLDNSGSCYKILPDNRLLIISTWGKLNIDPFGYDSTILVKH